MQTKPPIHSLTVVTDQGSAMANNKAKESPTARGTSEVKELTNARTVVINRGTVKVLAEEKVH
jgi:hypothetical protein